MQRSAVSISWFLRSVWPLDWGWYPEDRLTVAPRSEQNSLQNTEVNWEPRSETTSTGMPWRRMTWSSSRSSYAPRFFSLVTGTNFGIGWNRCWGRLDRSPPDPGGSFHSRLRGQTRSATGDQFGGKHWNVRHNTRTIWHWSRARSRLKCSQALTGGDSWPDEGVWLTGRVEQRQVMSRLWHKVLR